MPGECVFCQIVSGAVPAEVVLRTDEVTAFLDRRPLFFGHVLVIPNAHTETLDALPAAALAPLFAAVQRIALALERGLGAGGSLVALNNRVSQSVPHLHVHVVPRTKGDGLRGFFWPRRKYESEEMMRSYAARIVAALE